MHNEIDDTFRLSRLTADEQLSDPDALDEGLMAAYKKSIEFAEMLLDKEFAGVVRKAYLDFASDIAHHPVKSVVALDEELWTGYHPLLILFRRLEHYGVLGHYHYADSDRPAKSNALGREIALAERFHSLLPTNWFRTAEISGSGRFGEILLAAMGRYALDCDQDLTVDQIIAISGISRRSVQNALSAQDESRLRLNRAGQITNAEARRWLGKRDSFVPTEHYPKDEETRTVLSPEKPGEYEFIPQAKDNSQFRPEQRRPEGYQIGGKGEERWVEDYFEALKQLQSMPVARWRRPNENGKWGIVTAETWVRIPVAELKQT